MKWFNIKPKIRDTKSIFPGSEHAIEWAFNVGGIDYYQFADIYSLPYERGLMAVAVYNEMDMRCSRDYLLLHTEAIAEILRENPIDVFKIDELNRQMIQRLQLPHDTALLYRLASVAFFDKTENPAIYEQAIAEKKIEHWKRHRGVADFFLNKPLMELIPYLQNVQVDLNTFSLLTDELDALHLEKIRLLSSKKQPTTSKPGKSS